jgi:biotin carboxylase
MDVLFLAPAYPPEMQQFTRGLHEVGARVWGVGDTPADQLPGSLRRRLADYLWVPKILDEDDVVRRVEAWLAGRRPDRVEGLWEVVTALAARLRERLGVPGMLPDVVAGFRDKQLMKERIAKAGLRAPRSARAATVREIREAAETLGYPLVIKPTAGAGSLDTFRVGDPEGLERAVTATAHVPEVVVEEFVEGQEYTFETLCVEGQPVFTSVSVYHPNTLVARQNEWISPIILTLRDPDHPSVRDGAALGSAALSALGMGTGFTHMEWFRNPAGEPVFGEVACRPPGASMVDLMNYANDADLFVEWARIVCHGRFEAALPRPWNAALIFKRAAGHGRIRHIVGMDEFRRRHGQWIAREDLLPIGAPRRDWKQTFLSDGNLVVRHPDLEACEAMAHEAADAIRMYAG